jgi:RimJ/RimL family protein N-acetyltransferase
MRLLKGKNVELRPFRRSNLPNFVKWFNDPEVIQYLMFYLPMTEMAEEKFLEGLANNAGSDVYFVIEAIEQDGNKAIGSISLNGIHPKDHLATFGIAIGEKDYWNKGYGTEACRLIVNYGFKQLNLHRISSTAYSFNERSIRMHLRIGFREEGRQREVAFKNGKYCDKVIFGILREEWAESAER